MNDRLNIPQERIDASVESQRAYPGLEWTESEWFQTWLKLAREQSQHEEN